MDTVYASQTISLSEFKRNPAQVLRAAGDRPVAVLDHNRPAFYMVTPRLFELLVADLADHDDGDDRDLVEIARGRLTRRHAAIDVDIDRI